MNQNSKMTVLQVVPELNAGGVERTTIEMAEALHKAGQVPHVVSAGGRMEDEFIRQAGVLHRMDVGSKNPLTLRRHTKALLDIIKGCEIDIVHARSRAPAWPAEAAARAAGVPFVTTYHGIYNAKGRVKRRYNAVMTKGDVIIANSEFTKAHIIKEHGTEPDKIVVIPRGVDMGKFDPLKVSQTDTLAQREIWGVPHTAPLILLPGRLTRWKGQLVAINALAKLDKDCRLVLLGDAQGREDYLTEMRMKIDALGLTKQVIIPGHSENMPVAFGAADVVLSASTDPEAFGRVAAEAQAMRKPVVATAHGGAMETVLDGETGYLVAPGDADDMAAALTKALNWPGYNGKAARDRITREYSANQLKTATLAVYARVLREKAAK